MGFTNFSMGISGIDQNLNLVGYMTISIFDFFSHFFDFKFL